MSYHPKDYMINTRAFKEKLREFNYKVCCDKQETNIKEVFISQYLADNMILCRIISDKFHVAIYSKYDEIDEIQIRVKGNKHQLDHRHWPKYSIESALSNDDISRHVKVFILFNMDIFKRCIKGYNLR